MIIVIVVFVIVVVVFIIVVIAATIVILISISIIVIIIIAVVTIIIIVVVTSNVHTLLIIIAFQGAIRDFLQSPHSAASCLQHVRSSGPGAIVCKSRATHRALITCNMSCATWYEGTAQLLSLTEFISHLF